MIKDISKQRVNHKIGPVSISAEEIIGILESKSPVEVSAESNNFEFSSIDDIRSHKRLFSGRPKIRIDGVHISFERAYPQVAYYGSHENGASLARSIYLEIMSHRNFMDKFCEMAIFKALIGVPILLSFAVSSYFIKKHGIINNYTFVFDIINITYVAAYLIAHLWQGYSIFIRNPVYYSPRVGFWGRNKDTIWVSAITGIIGIGIGAVGGKLAEKIAAWL